MHSRHNMYIYHSPKSSSALKGAPWTSAPSGPVTSTALVLPFSVTVLNSTASPSANERNPDTLMLVWCTKISLSPLSGTMNPYPLAVSNLPDIMEKEPVSLEVPRTWKLVKFDVTRETYHLTVPVMRSSLIERLVICRGWVCGANPAATARVDSRTASFMVVTSLESIIGSKLWIWFDGVDKK